MAKLFQAERILPVWLDAAKQLAANHRESRNFLLEISDPTSLTKEDRDAIKIVDKALRERADISVNTVAATIFPQAMYTRYGRPVFYDEFKTRMKTAKKKGTWGTYALRIIERRAKNASESINPLEQVVEKLIRASTTGHPFKAAYELGVVEPSEDLDPIDSFGCELPTFDVKLDGGRVLGMPCLSHLSFKMSERKRVDLTAMYRSHYYCERALGNLIGLSQLLKFVADESGLEVGTLTCLSTHAYLDLENWNSSKPVALKILADVEKAMTN